MSKSVRVISSVLVVLATMWLVGCGHYVCRVTLGNSTCTPGTTTTSNNAAYVFSVNTLGQIDSYTLDSTANTLAATANYTAPTAAANSGGVGMVIAQGKYLYAGFGSTGQIYGYTIDATTGSLTEIGITSAPFLGFVGAGVSQAEMITNPAGTLLFAADTLQSQIYVFQIGTGGVLTLAPGSPVTIPLGFQPMNLATDGLGNYLYAVDGTFSTHTGSQVAAYAINNTSGSLGQLTAVTGSPFAYPMWQLKGDPTGQFMIGTSGKTVFYDLVDDTNLYVFSIAQSGAAAPGALNLVTTSPTTSSPYSIAMQSNSGGTLVYSFSFNDTATAFNAIEGYSLSSTGTLTAAGTFTGTANGSWGQFDPSGKYLFTYSSPSGASAQVGVLNVGSGGALTQPVTPVNLANPGFWAVADAQ